MKIFYNDYENMKTEFVPYVKREAIRAIKEGYSKTFVLPSMAKCFSARAQVSFVKAIYGGDFKCEVNSTLRSIKITRLSN